MGRILTTIWLLLLVGGCSPALKERLESAAYGGVNAADANRGETLLESGWSPAGDTWRQLTTPPAVRTVRPNPFNGNYEEPFVRFTYFRVDGYGEVVRDVALEDAVAFKSWLASNGIGYYEQWARALCLYWRGYCVYVV